MVIIIWHPFGDAGFGFLLLNMKLASFNCKDCAIVKVSPFSLHQPFGSAAYAVKYEIKFNCKFIGFSLELYQWKIQILLKEIQKKFLVDSLPGSLKSKVTLFNLSPSPQLSVFHKHFHRRSIAAKATFLVLCIALYYMIYWAYWSS